MYLAIDNETGGLGDSVSLLTSYLAVLDSDLNLIDDMEIALKPDNGVYQIEAQSLEITKINLFEHDKIAKTKSEVGQELFHFLDKHSQQGADKLIPLGHNISFDLSSLTRNIIKRETFEKYTSYRKVDTSTVARFLIQTGILPDIGAGLAALCEYFGIVNTKAHDAKSDVLATIEVYRAMCVLIKTGWKP